MEGIVFLALALRIEMMWWGGVVGGGVVGGGEVGEGEVGGGEVGGGEVGGGEVGGGEVGGGVLCALRPNTTSRGKLIPLMGRAN